MTNKQLTFLLVLWCAFGQCRLHPKEQNDSELTAKYKVFRIYPETTDQFKILKEWQQQATNFEIDFWKDARFNGDFADVMVAPSVLKKVEKELRDSDFKFVVTIPDVQKLIERNEKPKSQSKNAALSMGIRMKDDPLLDVTTKENKSRGVYDIKAKYPFGDYKSYMEMMKYLRTIEFYYPEIAKLIRIGTTNDDLPIEGIKLIGGYGSDPRITKFIDELDIFIFPCLNPDGYEYSRSSSDPQVRLWRKNRSSPKCIQTYWGKRFCCRGVDLNRNFDFHWAETGTSPIPCSNIYHGEHAFSEPESRAVRDFLTSEQMNGSLDGFITLHTYAQLWIHPFSHQTEVYPEDIIDIKTTAMKATEKLKGVYGTKYKIGTGANLLKPAAGGSDDWAKSTLGIKYVYLIELRPEYELLNGFILNEDELLPTAIETWEGVKEVIESALQYRAQVNLQAETPHSESLSAEKRQKSLEEHTSGPSLYFTGETAAETNVSEPIKSQNSSEIPVVGDFVSLNVTETSPMENTTIEHYEDMPSTGEPKSSSQSNNETVSERKELVSEVINDRQGNDKITKNNGTARICRDKMSGCEYWFLRDGGICYSQKTLMSEICAYTCKFCQ
ncbi:unnamed protein product [Enterobius vermicularis]|uniref:Zinc carboxypeptidase A 1 n=1 Tax=Enterobius vermicularis TaxID=51028 RepID=A0A0N4VID1_ENTVE|nr:unnamed protein product [Enterobius vermicularis]